MARCLKPAEIEKRIKIAEAKEVDPHVSYATLKSEFQTSTRVITSALSRSASEWRGMIVKADGHETGGDGTRYEHVTVEIIERKGDGGSTYTSTEEGAVKARVHEDGTLGLVLDDLAGEDRELVSVMVASGNAGVGTRTFLAVFKQPK